MEIQAHCLGVGVGVGIPGGVSLIPLSPQAPEAGHSLAPDQGPQPHPGPCNLTDPIRSATLAANPRRA